MENIKKVYDKLYEELLERLTYLENQTQTEEIKVRRNECMLTIVKMQELFLTEIIKPLPTTEDGEVLEYCCLGFPDEWFKIPDGIKDMRYFQPFKMRIKKPNGETKIVYDQLSK